MYGNKSKDDLKRNG